MDTDDDYDNDDDAPTLEHYMVLEPVDANLARIGVPTSISPTQNTIGQQTVTRNMALEQIISNAAVFPTSATMYATQTSSNDALHSMRPRTDFPLPPGYEVIMTDPRTGQQRMYIVQYRCVSMRRQDAMAFLATNTTMMASPDPLQSNPLAFQWHPQQSIQNQTPAQYQTGHITASLHQRQHGSFAARTTGTFPSYPSLLQPQQSPPQGIHIPPGSPPINISQGWGWTWHDGVWTIWKDDDGTRPSHANT
jgi:hypothetical protein